MDTVSHATANKGECVHYELEYLNEDGTPIDISDMTMGVCEALPIGLTAGVVELVDGPAGKARLSLSQALVTLMRPGKVNWLRVFFETPDGCRDVTPKIWFDLQ